jgi:hypothetical protein
MMPSKEGYALASTGTMFRYSHLQDHPFESDPNSPTIIRMWKFQGVEQLAAIDQHYKLNYGIAPITFDLLAGKIVTNGGDIQITVSRPPGVLSGRSQQDWSLKIEVPDGGLIRTSVGEARVTYAAPEGYYQPSETFSMSQTNNMWYEAVHQMLFIRSRNGQVYAKVNFSFRINQNPDDLMYVSFRGVANANGSRNWEGDPNTMRSVAQ